MRGELCRRWQNTTLHLNSGSLGSTQMSDGCPVVMRSKFTMSGESLAQGPTSPTTCRQVWSGFAMDGSGSIISHLAMRFWPETLSVCFRFPLASLIMAPRSRLLGAKAALLSRFDQVPVASRCGDADPREIT